MSKKFVKESSDNFVKKRKEKIEKMSGVTAHFPCLMLTNSKLSSSIPYMEWCENRKSTNHKYFKYANMTNEIPIHDLVFNNNTFNTNRIYSFRDINYDWPNLVYCQSE